VKSATGVILTAACFASPADNEAASLASFLCGSLANPMPVAKIDTSQKQSAGNDRIAGLVFLPEERKSKRANA
jgi:hypothetical protein